VYNHFLESYRTGERRVAGAGFRKRLEGLKTLKRDNGWLCSVSANALTCALDELNKAVNAVNRRRTDTRGGSGVGAPLPPTKLKKSVRQSYTIKGNGVSPAEGGRMRIPGVGDVPCRITREVEGRVTSAKVFRAVSGYYAVLHCSDVRPKILPRTGKSATVSAPELDPKRLGRLGRMKRRLSRKSIGGRNREKLNLRIARERERLANRETDVCHKLSTRLIRENDRINIKGELPERLRRQLEYKAKWRGRTLQAA
jgi:putative transposase